MVCYFKDKGPKLIRATQEGRMNTACGLLTYNRLIGSPWGTATTTSSGHPVYLLRPTPEDLVMSLRRISNINYPKDISRILYRLGIGPGGRIVEIGAGSGAMAVSLAHAVGVDGRIYAYDLREDMLRISAKNLRRAGLANRVELKLRERFSPVAETEVDAVVMDIPTPWEELDTAWQALRPGGYLACTVPTYDQLGELAVRLPENSFLPLESMEIFCRPLRAEKGRTRPLFKMVAHTQMIQFAAKVTMCAALGGSETGAEEQDESFNQGEWL